MRILFWICLGVLALTPCVSSQLILGANGLKLPPINLLAVYRILKGVWRSFFSPAAVEESKSINDVIKGSNDLPNTDDNLLDETTQINSSSSPTTETKLDQFLSNYTAAIFADEKSDLSLEEKGPAFWPEALRPAGWILSYIALNAVLLGLYLALAGPYYYDGPIALFGADPEDFFEQGSDMFMSFMMEENGLDEAESNGFEDKNRYDDMDDSNGVEENFNEPLQPHELHDHHYYCTEKIMCLRPFYGARALSTSSIFLSLLEFIPGYEKLDKSWNIGAKIKRLEEAVAMGRRGRQLDCRKYACPSIDE